MRSMARCVLPVLVGPSTAVTPAPRAPESRLLEEKKEMGIDDRNWEMTDVAAAITAGCVMLSVTLRRSQRTLKDSRSQIAAYSGFSPSVQAAPQAARSRRFGEDTCFHHVRQTPFPSDILTMGGQFTVRAHQSRTGAATRAQHGSRTPALPACHRGANQGAAETDFARRQIVLVKASDRRTRSGPSGENRFQHKWSSGLVDAMQPAWIAQAFLPAAPSLRALRACERNRFALNRQIALSVCSIV